MAPQRRRLAIAGILATAAWGLLLGRAVQIQALDAEPLARRAAAQHKSRLRLEPLRGEIQDRNGQRLAISADVESIAAFPRAIQDRRRAARRLAVALRLGSGEVADRLSPRRRFVWIKRWVTPVEAERVRRLGLEGVNLLTERKRFYPSRDLAGSLLGFVGHDRKGLSGVELAYDAVLRGRPTELQAVRDAHGALAVRDGRAGEASSGTPLVLALDARLQRFAERALDRALERVRARRGTLLALDPRSGELLAAADRPGFDPNRFWLEQPSRYRAGAFVDAFEPGSTLKPFVVTLALEAGAVRPQDRFDCENGTWRVRDRVLHDYRPHGVLDVRGIVRVSSNIGAAKIAERLGSERLVAGLRRLGFGRRTGSGFPGEVPGRVRTLRETQAVERANLAFGQGMTATAIQLAAIAASLSNGGRRVRPRLTRAPRSAPDAEPRLVSAEAARAVMGMMREVVTSGSGRAAALPRHAVAGKTGTAQKIVDGRYSEDRTVASFFGVVPAEDPRLVLVVVLDEPQRPRTGGGAAAPVFREVAAFAMENLATATEGAE
jgi:cell division protein FtsI (penicillin-binding protein 3)